MQLRVGFRLGPGEVVSVVGGGGKTTLMFRLADEIVAAGGRVLEAILRRMRQPGRAAL